jgi:hypothetical protein
MSKNFIFPDYIKNLKGKKFGNSSGNSRFPIFGGPNFTKKIGNRLLKKQKQQQQKQQQQQQKQQQQQQQQQEARDLLQQREQEDNALAVDEPELMRDEEEDEEEDNALAVDEPELMRDEEEDEAQIQVAELLEIQAAESVRRAQHVSNINTEAVSAQDIAVAAAQRQSAFAGREVEPREILEDIDELISQAAQPQFTALLGQEYRTIVFPGQELPLLENINTEGIPDPAWLVSLQQDLESARSFIVNGIVPFELIDRIRYYIDPTEEQQAQIRAERINAIERGAGLINNMPTLLDRLREYAYNDKRMAEVQKFARVFFEFYTSVETPGRIQTVYDELFPGGELLFPEKDNSMRRSHTHPGNKPKSGSSFKRIPEQIFGRDNEILSNFTKLIKIIGRADDILRGNYGVKARFAVWSPYGPGPAGLKRLFLIYDGVIEPGVGLHARESLTGNPDDAPEAQLISALNVVTASAGGGAITAEAVAPAQIRRRTHEAAATASTRGEVSAWSPSFPGETQWDPVIISGVNSLLKIPIRDAYQAWYAAQWTQSNLRHEERVGPDILAAHCRMIEFRLGYVSGIQFRHMPTFYQITLERPIMEARKRICSLYQGATSNLISVGKSISQGGEWICNLLGVSTERREGVKTRLSQEELDNLARLNAVARINVSARTSYDAIGPDARAALDRLARHSRFVQSSLEQAGSDIQGIVQVAQTTIAAISADERLRRIAARMGETGTAAAASGRRGIESGRRSIESGTAASGRQSSVFGTAAAKQFAAKASAGVAGLVSTGDFSIARSMMEIVVPNAISTIAQGTQIDQNIVASGNMGQGPSIDINCRQIVEGGGGGGGVVDSVMTVSPVIVLPLLPLLPLAGGGQIGTQIVTNQDVDIVRLEVEPEVADVLTTMILTIEERGAARGIRGKKGPKRLTRREIQRRETKKGKKGKGKGRGTKKRGKRRRTSNKGMPTNTMQILKQKLKL